MLEHELNDEDTREIGKYKKLAQEQIRQIRALACRPREVVCSDHKTVFR